MPGVFVGSTELTTVGDIKIDGVDVQQVFVGATQVFPTGGPDPSITFSWDPENDEALPGGTTFTRASVAEEFSGTAFSQVSSGTIRAAHVAEAGQGKGFLPEPSAINRMNTVDLSDSGNWTRFSIGDVTDNGVSSLGLNEYAVDAGAATAVHRLNDISTSGGSGSIYAIAEEDTGRFFCTRRGGSSATNYSTFDLQLGNITEEGSSSSGAFVTDLANGRYKCEWFTTDTGSTVDIALSDTGTPGTGNPNFNASNETILFSHIQFETTPFSTTPIITSGTPVTREADVLDTGIAISTEFSALLDVTLPLLVGSGLTITLLGPDTTAEDVLRVDDTGAIIMDDGGTPVTIGTVTLGTRFKISYGRDGSGRSASLDGATAVTGGAPGAGHEGENFELGSRAGINQSRCVHHLTTLFDVKKSDAELEALSS